ncbi:unnamed protein product [Coregonus sp. 'balchen']|nr:unnamed protein product [Coregonus sp. 'balchen']
MGCRVFLAVILGVVCLLSHCQKYDVEFDGDELFYVDPVIFRVERRLSEFAQQWTLDPGLPHEVYVSLGTCKYNIPRCIEGDIYSFSVGHVSLQEPLTRIWEVEVHTDHQTVETAVCVGGVTLGVVGVATGVWFIKKAKRSA